MKKITQLQASALIMLILSFGLCACGGGGSGGGGKTAPVKTDFIVPEITNINISPLNFHFSGGEVSVSATATDNESVHSVSFVLSGPSSQNVSATKLGDDYSGTITLPANNNLAETDAAYSLRIKARDTAGNETYSSIYALTVKSMKRPPDPPIIP